MRSVEEIISTEKMKVSLDITAIIEKIELISMARVVDGGKKEWCLCTVLDAVSSNLVGRKTTQGEKNRKNCRKIYLIPL